MHLQFIFIIFTSHFLCSSVVDAGSKKRVNYHPSFMSTDDVISYFKSFFAKSSSMDRTNEIFYSPEEYSEDLYHKIDNLMPLETFIKWLMKTKDITDKTNEKKVSLLSKYGGSVNAPCNPLSVFNQTLQKIIKTWDGDKTIVTNELEEWQRLNERIPPYALCNRFRGLMCKFQRAISPDLDQGKATEPSENSTCQCGGDPTNVGFFSAPLINNREVTALQTPSYPDGCYIRPWRPCRHLSAVDNAFKGTYEEWHGGLENERRMLAQMVFPVARTHRCKQGTYCLDMVPGMKKPVCWCSANSNDPDCAITWKKHVNRTDAILPISGDLMALRKIFASLIIPASDTRSACNPEYNELVEKISAGAGIDPSKSDAYAAMKKLVLTGRSIRICDFREALVCDQMSRTCKGTLNCGPGKVHLGKGVCVSDNGYRCQSNEDCVQNARCTYFKEVSDSACVCNLGYGDECHLHNAPFFGQRFLPLVSGFQDEEYLKLEVEIFKTLESWEDAMRLKAGDPCDSNIDQDSMEVVQYFGSLTKYDKEKGARLLSKAHKVTRDSAGLLCPYTQFLRCDSEQRKCVPFVGKKTLLKKNSFGDNRIVVAIEPDMECDTKIPQIFEDKVTITCMQGYKCEAKGAKNVCVPDCLSPFAPKKVCPVSPVTEKHLGLMPRFQNIGGEDGDGDNMTSTEAETSDEPTTEEAESSTEETDPSTEDMGDLTSSTEDMEASSEETFTSTEETPFPEELSSTEPIPEDLNSTTTEAPPVETEQPGYGSKCDTRTDCDAAKFMDCQIGSCGCMLDLVRPVSANGSCKIGPDEPCKAEALFRLRKEKYGVMNPPKCKKPTICADVNRGHFCRPPIEDGFMFVTKEMRKKLGDGEPNVGNGRALSEESDETDDSSANIIAQTRPATVLAASLLFLLVHSSYQRIYLSECSVIN